MTSNPTRIRGACPVLNMFANHGIINSTGTKLNIFQTTTEIAKASGLPRFLLQTFILYVFIKKFTTFNIFNFSLQDISDHGVIEHDNSMARKDFKIQPDQSLISKDALQEYLALQKDGYLYQSDVLALKELKYEKKVNRSYFFDKIVPTIEVSGFFEVFGTKVSMATHSTAAKKISDVKISVQDFETILLEEKLPDSYDKVPVPINPPHHPSHNK